MRVTSTDICFMSARELSALLHARALSARDVMTAYLRQIEKLNPTLNAIVAKLPDEECLALADAADRHAAKSGTLSPLHGLPVAFKDLEPAIGFPWTRGSPIYRNERPSFDSLLVSACGTPARPYRKYERARVRHGSHTYNTVYGTTLNPYDTSKSAGGSSGGAGAALASGMLPLADGSDLGASLRNPANFNNIVALRPTMGLVPSAPDAMPPPGFSVKGPMARSVADAAWLLSVLAGPDPRDPACVPSEPSAFAGRLQRSFGATRVAWCPDLGGLPLDARVRSVLESQRKTFEQLGCIVEEAHPDLSDAESIFLTIRAWRNAAVHGPLLAAHRDRLKPEAIGEIERGLALTGADVARALIAHGQLMDRMRQFEEDYEFTICAVNQVPPFDATLDWPKAIDGVRLDNYIDWMSPYWFSRDLCPAISLPAGFTRKDCRSASRSSGVIATTLVCYR